MGIKEEMEKLGVDIIDSYDVRVEKIGQIKKETEEALKSTRGLLNNLQDDHKKMSLEQRESLSKYKENLQDDAKEMLKGFRLSLEKMGSHLRQDLAKSAEKRTAEVNKTLENTQKMMDGFKVAHSQMSKELKKDLSKSNQEMKSKVSKMLNDFRSTQDKLRAELEKASLSWQQTASTLQEKRSGGKPVSKGLEKKIVKEKLPKKTKIMEELSDKVQTLDLVQKHPEGLKLTEIGVELGKDWRWYIPIVKELLEENKIRKEENLYYPMI
jgi:DNA-binding ferritin-like protein